MEEIAIFSEQNPLLAGIILVVLAILLAYFRIFKKGLSYKNDFDNLNWEDLIWSCGLTLMLLIAGVFFLLKV